MKDNTKPNLEVHNIKRPYKKVKKINTLAAHVSFQIQVRHFVHGKTFSLMSNEIVSSPMYLGLNPSLPDLIPLL